MLRRFLLTVLVVGALATCVLAEEKAAPKTIKGTVESIAEDGNKIVVDGTTIQTTTELLDSNYVEVGDKIIVNVEDTPKGPKALAIDYQTEESPALEGTPAVNEPTSTEAPVMANTEAGTPKTVETPQANNEQPLNVEKPLNAEKTLNTEK